MYHRILDVLFPPKCVLCKKRLAPEETDLCHSCRQETEEFGKGKKKHSFLAGWVCIWYYKDNVRLSLLRFKFYNRRSYAQSYGKLLAMQLQKQNMTDFDILTWAPIARLRKWRRGYDQCELLAQAVAGELGTEAVRTLRKIRNVPPQSSIRDASARRANVLGAYKAVGDVSLKGKRVLLLDDIITTGATASECARVLLSAGAKEVYLGAVASASTNDKKCR